MPKDTTNENDCPFVTGHIEANPLLFFITVAKSTSAMFENFYFCVGYVDLNGLFTFEQAMLRSFLPFVTVSKSSGKRYL